MSADDSTKTEGDLKSSGSLSQSGASQSASTKPSTGLVCISVRLMCIIGYFPCSSFNAQCFRINTDGYLSYFLRIFVCILKNSFVLHILVIWMFYAN